MFMAADYCFGSKDKYKKGNKSQEKNKNTKSNNAGFNIYDSNINTKNEKGLNSKFNPKSFHYYKEKNQMYSGIINYGNNCYLNTGLQILASCDFFVEELQKIRSHKNSLVNLIKDAFDLLQQGHQYDPKNFIEYLSKNITEFNIGEKNCSQNFIRLLLNNINNELVEKEEFCIYENNQYKPFSKSIEYIEYMKFIEENKIYPQSKLLSIFSGMSISLSTKRCEYCQNLIGNYFFNYFIDQIIYLDEIKRNCSFSDVFRKNFEESILTMNCPKCSKEIKIKEETKIIKLPPVLIFTLERSQGNSINKVEIFPEEIIDFRKCIHPSLTLESTRYELFAINIRFGEIMGYGHAICLVKNKGKWFEYNDLNVKAIQNCQVYNNHIYGLFYKRVGH